MLAHKLRDEETERLITNIDSILTGENKKYKDIIMEKCIKFHQENQDLLSDNDFSINLDGFEFKSENEIKYERLLKEFIYEQLKEIKGHDKDEK